MTSGEAGVARGMVRQLAAVGDRLAGGETRTGWKVGLNLPAVQQHLGIERPVVGQLTSGTRLDPGATVSLSGYTRAGAEPEIAATLGADGQPQAIAAAIELVDIDLGFDDVEPILAANVFHRGWVAGPAVPRADVDLEALTARVTRAGAVEYEARVGEAMGSLENVLGDVAGRVAAAGETLRPGDVVICGSLTPIVWVAPGETIEVDIGPLGGLALSFSSS
jgi:2-keto-4-pentenoate hydratase